MDEPFTKGIFGVSLGLVISLTVIFVLGIFLG